MQCWIQWCCIAIIIVALLYEHMRRMLSLPPWIRGKSINRTGLYTSCSGIHLLYVCQIIVPVSDHQFAGLSALSLSLAWVKRTRPQQYGTITG